LQGIVGEGKTSIPTGAEAVAAAVEAANDASHKAALAGKASIGLPRQHVPAAVPQPQPSPSLFQSSDENGYVSQWAMMHGGVGNIKVPGFDDDDTSNNNPAAADVETPSSSVSSKETSHESRGKEDRHTHRDAKRDEDELRNRDGVHAHADGADDDRKGDDRHASLRALLRKLSRRNSE
jgi:hypothetical protein